MKVEYRPALANDLAFIMDSWLNSWRQSPWAGVIPNNQYYPLTRGVIEALVMRGATFEIACSGDNPDQILGWICRESTNEPTPHTVVHCLYSKDPYIKLGVNRQLVQRCPGAKPGFYTFRTRQTEAVCREAGFKHAPEIARRR